MSPSKGVQEQCPLCGPPLAELGCYRTNSECAEVAAGHRETAFAELQRRWREQNPSQLRQRPTLMPSDELRCALWMPCARMQKRAISLRRVLCA